MADNSTFAATAELARTAAFVAANRATICRKQNCGETNGLDKRGLCVTHAASREASLRQDAVNLNERPTIPQATTIASLLSGPSGFAQVSGADLDHCNQALSARANLASTIKALGKYESHLIAYPNSVSAWETYSRMYDRIDECVRQIKHFEGLLKQSWPSLKTFPIHVPIKLERAPERTWLDVS